MPRRSRRRHLRRRLIDVQLDLHGVRHRDVPEAVHRFVNDHWASGWRLRIVTGGSDEMRRLVLGVLLMYDVDPQVDDWNPGVVVVDIAW